MAGGAKPPPGPPLNDRSSHLIEAAKRGGSAGALPPPLPQTRGSGGQRPPAKTEKNLKIFRKFLKKNSRYTFPGRRPGPGELVDRSIARDDRTAPKKKAFDRGGPVWPPRSNVTNDRLRGGVWGGFAPPAKNRGAWWAAPPSQIF